LPQIALFVEDEDEFPAPFLFDQAAKIGKVQQIRPCGTLKISLIREKPALLFWDIPGLKPVWLSGTVMLPEMTANNTYWKANKNQK